MKKRFLYTLLGIWGLLLGSCSEESITPQINVEPEYNHLLNLTENSIHADTVICEWYKKYNCAVLYNYKKEDFQWLWASKLSNYNTKFDISVKEDSIALEKVVDYIQTKLFSYYNDEFLATNLSYKIFICKELHESGSITSNFTNVITNFQDAMILGYLKDSKGGAYSATNFETNLGTVFMQLFFDKLPQKPTKFLECLVPLQIASMVTMPKDPAIKEEQKVYPDFVDKESVTGRQQHCANVIGFIKTKGPLGPPSQGQDYADYLAFITKNPGSYIRQMTQYYWRIAKRGTLFLEFYRDVNHEDLIATQNANFPNDKVTLEDFHYTEK